MSVDDEGTVTLPYDPRTHEQIEADVEQFGLRIRKPVVL